MRSQSLAFAAACAVCVSVATRAHADERADLEKGRAAYLAKNYEDADQRFRAMLSPQTGSLHDPAFVAEGRMYWGATMLAEAKPDEARQIFRRLVLDKPDYEPDPTQLPPSVVYFFIDVRSKMHDELRDEEAKKLAAALEAKRLKDLQLEHQRKLLDALTKQAGEETIVHSNSRFLALVPFGAGQFQNGDKVLGWVLLTTEAALVGTGSGFFIAYRIQFANSAEAESAGDKTRAQGWLDRANASRIANLAIYGAFALEAALGILQGELAFVPETKETRPRALPAVTFAPIVSPLVSGPEGGVRGVFVGAAGRF